MFAWCAIGSRKERASTQPNRSIDEERKGSCNTTDIHLPRRIGEAVKRAFHGTLDEHFDEGGYFVRVNWVSDI
jgi:hypothetical protein